MNGTARPLSAPPVGKSSRVLGPELVLEMSGEAEAAEVREVALRNMAISAVDTAMAEQPWPRLEAVSLSQNPLGCGDGATQLWGWLGQCDALRCLNLNFCELASLEVRARAIWEREAAPRAARCAALPAAAVWPFAPDSHPRGSHARLQGIQSLVGLEQLYVSTNQLSDLSPLGGCRELRTLVLHRNALDDLDACMTALGGLGQLAGARRRRQPPAASRQPPSRR